MSSQGQPGLVFYPKSHRYKLDGRWVPGVTTLIGDGLPKKALMYWSARTVAEFVADNADTVENLRHAGRAPLVAALKETPWQKRDDAADRGTVVHAIAERVARGEAVEVADTVAGYVEAAVAFLDDWRVDPLVVERPIAHRTHWWAGTADLFGRLPDGRVAIVDWKTADSGVWPETALQLAAYSHGEFYLHNDGSEQPLPTVDLALAVHLQPGGYTAYEMKSDDASYIDFRHIARVARVGKSMKDEPQVWMREVSAPTVPTLEVVA
jgi:hypothetical protein